MEMSDHLQNSAPFTPWSSPSTRWIEDLVGFRAYLDAVEKWKICSNRESNPDAPVVVPVA
jgi:hypothetical protein